MKSSVRHKKLARLAVAPFAEGYEICVAQISPATQISPLLNYLAAKEAPSLPISSQHFAPYPFPPQTKVTPAAKVSM